MLSRKTPFIQVVSWINNNVKDPSQEAAFYLEMDNWNDYHYFTSYHLHADGRFFPDGQISLIGSLRILKRGQTTGVHDRIKIGPLDELGEDYCSMPNALDYYERLSQLPQDIRDKILISLRDLVIYPEIREEFKDEEGYKVSLLRNINEDDQIFQLAPLLLSRNYSKLQDMDLGFSFRTPEMEQPLEIDFRSPTYGWNSQSLPNRIVVLIGKNGSGKSTLLNRLSRIAYASTIDRSDETARRIGVLEPNGLGFTRIVALSYSAFDAFNTPGFYKGEKLAIIEEMKNGLGRYVFCGIRDIVRELEEVVPNLQTRSDGKLRAEDVVRDRTEHTQLKSNAELAAEFSRNISYISKLKSAETLRQALVDLEEESSMYGMFPLDLTLNSTTENQQFFKDLSTGHKFVLHAVTSIIAFAAPRALFLFDEPETHLHPPMLAVLMKAIRRILNEKDAFMILATHSPVILQETLHRHVSVVRKQGTTLTISKPEIQTFGENIGILTQLAFGLTAEVSDYHNTLQEVIDSFTIWGTTKDPDAIIEEMEKIFDIGLSVQARSYVISKLYQK